MTTRLYTVIAFVFAGSVGCGGPPQPVSAPTEIEPLEAEAPPAEEAGALVRGPEVMDGQAVSRWIKAVVAVQNQQSRPVPVLVPVVIRSLGWGCRCPDYFVGDSPNMHPGGDTWLTLDQSGLATPVATYAAERLEAGPNPCEEHGDERDEISPLEELGAVLIVEGSFTGDRTEVDLRDDSGEPAEWLYQTWNLRVTRILGLAAEVEGEDEDLRVYGPIEWTDDE